MSGWTALTIHTKDKTKNKKLDKDLRNLYPDDADGYGDRTVQLARMANHWESAVEFAREFPVADTIIVVSANDTTDSGNGSLFQITLNSDGSKDEFYNSHPIDKIDEKVGAEGDVGKDVVSYFSDEYDLDCHARYDA